jgi:hypothetical protein
MNLRTFCGASRSRSSRDRPSASPPSWIHHVNKLLGSPLKVLQLLLALLQLLLALLQLLLLLLPFFAKCLDLLEAVDELLFSVSDNLLQPLDVICMVIQHIHISKQLFFIC